MLLKQVCPILLHPWVIRLRVRRGVDKEYIPIPVGYLPAVVVCPSNKVLVALFN